MKLTLLAILALVLIFSGFAMHSDSFAQNPAGSNSGVLNQLFTGVIAPSGITNSTGLQLFNTATSCTTAATISTPCTTTAISLPVGYGDTNYRVSCTGLVPTAFPQIQTVTKSNTSFTITLNNLTAAAATYASFDCQVAHN